MTEPVRVVVRLKPLSEEETSRGLQPIVKENLELNQIEITNPETRWQDVFEFDQVFAGSSEDSAVYREGVSWLVDNFFHNQSGALSIYGSKSNSMLGEAQESVLLRHLIHSVFEDLPENAQMRCSYFEVRNEEIRDLLHPHPVGKLKVKESAESGAYITHLSEPRINDPEEILQVLRNANSSKTPTAHTVFMLYLHRHTNPEIQSSKLTIVDWSAEEDTCLQTFKKVVYENNLSAIKESAITKLLKDAFRGVAKTTMLGFVSPINYEESLETLKLASCLFKNKAEERLPSRLSHKQESRQIRRRQVSLTPLRDEEKEKDRDKEKERKEEDNLKKMVHQWRAKYKNALSQIEENNRAFEKEREKFSSELNSKNTEISFLSQLIKQFIDPAEIYKIKQKSFFDDENKVWQIPNFSLQNKQTVFPKIQRPHIKDYSQQEARKKKLVFRNYGISPSPDIFNIDEASDEEKDQYPTITRCNLDSLIGSFPTKGEEVDLRPITSGARSRHQARKHIARR